MAHWLTAALDYLPRWLEHQLRVTELPGVSIAVAHRGRLVLTEAFGHANLASGEALTPRHAFRVASHSKTFTAAAVMKLRDQGRLRLDDPVGRHVEGLHRAVAETTLTQLLSHTAGLVRDGEDAGQWLERRPFLDEAELRADLARGPSIEPNTRFKYSNHGYGLLGLVIEAVTGETYRDWVAREIVAASRLDDTWPDMPEHGTMPRLASGHSTQWPLGRRLVVPAAMSTRALAAATGFVSTPGDLARFFSSLAPEARNRVLSAASRREMTRSQWLEPHAVAPRWYGLGTFQGTAQLGPVVAGGWSWFGHSGSFLGTLSRTCVVPSEALAVSVATNASDGLAEAWLDGSLQVLRACAAFGAPTRRTAAWKGRWWSLWGALDLLALKDRVLVCNPMLAAPLTNAPEIGAIKGDHGRIVQANGFASHGEPAALLRDGRGRVEALRLGGTRLLREKAAARELEKRYGAS